VISGLPGSGKTTLGGQIAHLLNLPLIDKDDILLELFDAKGMGDAVWRRSLSRESDGIFQRKAAAAGGGVLVSFWRLDRMAEDSGIPTEWIRGVCRPIAHVHCVCAPEIAAERFCRRKRHPGHLDSTHAFEEILAGIQKLARLNPPDLGARIDVDTACKPNVDELVRQIHRVLAGQQ